MSMSYFLPFPDISMSLFQNGIVQLSETQEFLAGQVADTLARKQQLLSQVHVLESQVLQLQNSPRLPGESGVLDSAHLGFSSTHPSKYRAAADSRKRHLVDTEPENLNPNSMDACVDKGVMGKRSRPAGKKSKNAGAQKNAPKDFNVNINSQANNHLSIRRLLENTGTDLCVKPADPVASKVKVNGHLERTDFDLTAQRPSLPISIPLDCLPGNNMRTNDGKIGQTSKNASVGVSGIGSVNSRNELVTGFSHNENTQVSASEQTALSAKSSSWTPANFTSNATSVNSSRKNFAMDKMIIPKKRGHVFNGSTTEMVKQSIINRVESNKLAKDMLLICAPPPKTKGKGGRRSKANQELVDDKSLVGKGLLTTVSSQQLAGNVVLVTTSGSPETRHNTAMLISTANQPIAISAIPSPDVRARNFILRNEGNPHHFRKPCYFMVHCESSYPNFF